MTHLDVWLALGSGALSLAEKVSGNSPAMNDIIKRAATYLYM